MGNVDGCQVVSGKCPYGIVNASDTFMKNCIRCDPVLGKKFLLESIAKRSFIEVSRRSMKMKKRGGGNK